MFADVVTLYREAERPALDAGRFAFVGVATASLRAAISRCESLGDTFGRFEDGPDWSGDSVEFSWIVSANEHGRFFENVSDLVDRSQSLSQGKRPQNFYLIEEDYFSTEADVPEQLEHAYELCELVQHLGSISLSADVSPSTHPKEIIFVIPAGEKAPPRTLTLLTRLDSSALSVGPLDLAPLRRLVAGDASNALHSHELRGLFRLAIADAVGRAPTSEKAFLFLVKNWPEVLEKYSFDVDCYLSNFSFEKVRLEIAQMELDFSSRLSSVLGDSAAKFLALPVPIAVLAAIYKVDGVVESYLLFFGSFVIVMLFSGLIYNQLLQLNRIGHSYDVITDQFNKKSKSYPESITTRLREVQRGVSRQRSFLLRILRILRIIAWIPIFASLALLAWKFHPGFQTWIGHVT